MQWTGISSNISQLTAISLLYTEKIAESVFSYVFIIIYFMANLRKRCESYIVTETIQYSQCLSNTISTNLPISICWVSCQEQQSFWEGAIILPKYFSALSLLDGISCLDSSYEKCCFGGLLFRSKTHCNCQSL